MVDPRPTVTAAVGGEPLGVFCEATFVDFCAGGVVPLMSERFLPLMEACFTATFQSSRPVLMDSGESDPDTLAVSDCASSSESDRLIWDVFDFLVAEEGWDLRPKTVA